MRRPTWHKSRRLTQVCDAVVLRPIRTWRLPQAATVVVVTARARLGAIDRDWWHRLALLNLLGRRARLPPRRLPCLGRRTCATCDFWRPVGLHCRR